MRVLLVEDNVRLSEYLAQGLAAAGLTTDVVYTGEDALNALHTAPYDALVLDLGLPDTDGIEVISKIRSNNVTLPILVLTARDTVKDRVQGLNTGADDYLAKPAALEELVARLRAFFRRPVETQVASYKVANVSFNVMTREVRINDKAVHIPRRELAALEQLMLRSGQVVPKETLEDKIYGFNDEASRNSLEAVVSRLRKLLRDLDGNAVIHTFRGLGYLLRESK